MHLFSNISIIYIWTDSEASNWIVKDHYGVLLSVIEVHFYLSILDVIITRFFWYGLLLLSMTKIPCFLFCCVMVQHETNLIGIKSVSL